MLVTAWESGIDILPFKYTIIKGKILQETGFLFYFVLILFMQRGYLDIHIQKFGNTSV